MKPITVIESSVLKEYVSGLNQAELEKLSICFATNHPADVADILSKNKAVDAFLGTAKNFEETFSILDSLEMMVKSEQVHRNSSPGKQKAA